MPKPEKKERNQEIIQRRKEGWTYRKLASFYNIKHPTVINIVKREEERAVAKDLTR